MRKTTPDQLVAIEVEPISDLSLESEGGLKILVEGPVELKSGMLMLMRENVTVLGGCVPHLANMKAMAQIQAKKLADRIGNDATVQALCWNSDDEGEEGESGGGDDEGVVDDQIIEARRVEKERRQELQVQQQQVQQQQQQQQVQQRR